MIIRKAETSEYEKLRDFYWQLIDDMQAAPYSPQWKKDIYPSSGDLREAVDNGEAFIADDNGRIAAAMRLNSTPVEDYRKVRWSLKADDSEVLYVHLLGVGTEYQRKSLGKKMVSSAVELARSRGLKALRLDVIAGNLPAFRLYESMGFISAGNMQLYYEDTGLADFSLFEYLL